ncbi:hypothetical protein GCM10027168_50410 [Streptomyces capparidis]
MSRRSGAGRPGGHPLTLVRDQPRPEGGALVPVGPGGAGRAGPGAGRTAAPAASEALRERAEELRRVREEYAAFRGRVRRDRLAVREIAVANVLGGLLPVLDAIAGARAQGEVTGGFARVAEVLERELAELGLRAFGAVGEPFDPAVHEAVSYATGPEVRGPTCVAVLRPGYRVGDHLLRPAQVAVAGPPDEGPREPDGPAG